MGEGTTSPCPGYAMWAGTACVTSAALTQHFSEPCRPSLLQAKLPLISQCSVSLSGSTLSGSHAVFLSTLSSLGSC